jgi:hypothetical protein
VERLLTIASDPDGLAELQRQEPYVRPFLTEPDRRRAYPFTAGLALDSNLVTLLAWADHLGVAPARPNRFFQAKAAGFLGRLEADKRHTVSYSLYRTGLILTSVGTALAVLAAVGVLVLDRHALLRPFGWWSPLLWLGTAVVSYALFAVLLILGEEAGPDSWLYYLDEEYGPDGGHIRLSPRFSEVGCLLGLAGPIAFSVAVAPLAGRSLPAYLAAAMLGLPLVFWLPATTLFSRRTRFYLYRPNDFIDAYDDPGSAHWLRPGSRPVSPE